ncbi:uncharacterized protein N7459_000462 [Penicillium hispanicum]|uniref:uncharacterized protein n=1 Tax=Penicillium hispanicum TaxID=1080232 RepID=UPI00254137E2|nr:uncharacterized protein N7459_000462 [Penicillium hispanicum]KAJ5594254.1 hypothetical protein N7459_000462 [Penicillium hispanicum]
MVEKAREPNFVVITGNPERGHGGRLSQIRSYTATKQHRRERDRKAQTHGVFPTVLTLQHALSQRPQEISLAPSAPPLPPSATGRRRMQKFMYHYVRDSHRVHPFFSTVISAAISHPALMSSKILNASAWDDLSAVGRISGLTLQQGAITRRLFDESVRTREEVCSDVNIATLIAILLFDLVSQENETFYKDQQWLQRIIALRGGPAHLGFDGHLRNSLRLINQLQRIGITARHTGQTPSSSDIDSFPCGCIDVSVFTLGKQSNDPLERSKMLGILPLLDRLYQTMMPPRESITCGSLWSIEHQKSTVSAISEGCPFSTATPVHENSDSLHDARVPAVLQVIHILNISTGAASHVGPIDMLCALGHLKDLLQRTNLVGFWENLPGALIWCLVIGARLSSSRPIRQWFLMQTTRITCALAMSSCDAVLQSLRAVLAGLDETARQRLEIFSHASDSDRLPLL